MSFRAKISDVDEKNGSFITNIHASPYFEYMPDVNPF